MSEVASVSEVVPRLLPARQRLEFDEIFVDGTNALAVGALKAMANGDNQYNPIFLFGGCGLAKTHLLHSVQRTWQRNFPKEVVRYFTAEAFCNLFLEALRDKTKGKMDKFRDWYRHAGCLLVDETSFLEGKKGTQNEFLATISEVLGRGARLVCASNVPLKDLDLIEPLISRLSSGLVVKISPLEYGTRLGVLDRFIGRSHQSGLWSTDLREFIASHTNGDARILGGVFKSLEAYGHLLGQPLTLDLAKKVLDEYVVSDGNLLSGGISLETLEKATEKYFGLISGGGQLRSTSRDRIVSYPRQVAIFLAKKLIGGITLSDIGDHFGGRDHTTVLFSIRKIERNLNKEGSAEIKKQLEGVCSILNVKWPV